MLILFFIFIHIAFKSIFMTGYFYMYFLRFHYMSHGHICHKQLREKVGVKVRFFIGVSQCTQTDFLSQTKHRTYLMIFYRSVIWRTQLDFLSELVCLTMAGEVTLLDYVTRFFIRLKSVHTYLYLQNRLYFIVQNIKEEKTLYNCAVTYQFQKPEILCKKILMQWNKKSICVNCKINRVG